MFYNIVYCNTSYSIILHTITITYSYIYIYIHNVHIFMYLLYVYIDLYEKILGGPAHILAIHAG